MLDQFVIDISDVSWQREEKHILRHIHWQVKKGSTGVWSAKMVQVKRACSILFAAILGRQRGKCLYWVTDTAKWTCATCANQSAGSVPR